MTHAKRLWSIWQALLSAFAWAFTGPSFRRFAEWVTAMAINGGAIAPVPRISTKSGPFSPGEWLESLPGSARGY